MTRAIVFAVAFGAAACGGTVQRQARGQSFELTRKEASLADEYAHQEPHAADDEARCAYWSRRREEANGSHVIGLFSWSPDYFVHLREWTEAKKTETCTVAKVLADAEAARKLEEDRVVALAVAKREHQARDDRGWAGAHPDDCARAAGEDACEGIRGYLSAVPDGAHAAEATAALRAAAPKLAELVRAREEESVRRATAIARQEEAAGFRVSAMRAMLDDAPPGSARGHYLRIAFDLTAIRPVARGVTPIVRTACQVADKRMVDLDSGLDLRLNELAAGDTKVIEANPYVKNALQGSPSRCDIVVMKATALETTGPVVHSFCYVPGQGAKEGPCGP